MRLCSRSKFVPEQCKWSINIAGKHRKISKYAYEKSSFASQKNCCLLRQKSPVCACLTGAQCVNFHCLPFCSLFSLIVKHLKFASGYLIFISTTIDFLRMKHPSCTREFILFPLKMSVNPDDGFPLGIQQRKNLDLTHQIYFCTF